MEKNSYVEFLQIPVNFQVATFSQIRTIFREKSTAVKRWRYDGPVML